MAASVGAGDLHLIRAALGRGERAGGLPLVVGGHVLAGDFRILDVTGPGIGASVGILLQGTIPLVIVIDHVQRLVGRRVAVPIHGKQVDI